MEKLELRDVQKTAVGILQKIDFICQQLHIKYFIAYGTLIGAIRHQGFIPWDDDIDIMMSRPDYEIFMAFWKDNIDNLKPYECMTIENNPLYPHMITRISDSRTWLDVINEKDCGLGVFVDIFVLEGLGNDYKKALAIMRKARNISSLLFLSSRKYFHFGLTKGILKKILKIPAYIYTHLLGKMYFVNKSKKLVKGLDFEKSNYVGPVYWLTYSPEKEIIPKNWAEELIRVKFEGYDFFAPEHYDEILRNIYGDYMQLPPEKDRIAHHLYVAYKK